MQALGFTSDDFGGEDVPIWPDNWQAFKLFEALSTQWRTGPAGPTGLDYGAIEVVARLAAVDSSQLPDLFPAIRVMEGAALSVIHEKED